MGEVSAQWFVISTKLRREQFAQEQLARRGVETFLPRIVAPVRPAGKNAVLPLFPNYLFVRIALEDQYFDVAWTPGVKRFICFGATPVPVDDSAVAFLQERVGPEGVLCVVPVFRAGDLVRVRYGPLAGLVGIIEHPGSTRGRVRVLMELLKRQTRVELPQQLVERVSA